MKLKLMSSATAREYCVAGRPDGRGHHDEQAITLTKSQRRTM